MNYPIWGLPASGLLIAGVAILHVFISHFAVGGGLFLVLTERRARRGGDAALLAYVRKLSRFFILLTLVLGAISGVGIWFTITLVHPSATSALIQTFVWGWAIEWTFFLTEIAAALVYYYGWDRLAPRTHLAVGWIYFAAAWLSLVVINGILSFMLTPGEWLTTRSFWDGFFNPTYWPSVAARTCAAIGLAGIYALFTAAALDDAALKERIARRAGLGWVIPMAIFLPLSVVWYLSAAAGAGIPVAEMFGADSARTADLLAALFSGASVTGHPFAKTALRVAAGGAAFALAAVLFLSLARRRTYGRVLTGAILVAGLAVIGGGEWTREDLRKPYVLGSQMLVNGIRLPAARGAPSPPAGFEHRFTLDALARSGVLPAALWAKVPEGWSAQAGGANEEEAGRELFRLECSACHTRDGYNAIRPLVAGLSSDTLEGFLDLLARPVDAVGNETSWDDPELRLDTWLGRRMPPFVGTAAEKRALAVYLARLGGGEVGPRPPGRTGGAAASAADRASDAIPLPQPDPVPVRAPGWLPLALLLLTFFLHILGMNWVLGGSLLAVAARARARSGSAHHAELARRIGKSLPVAVAAAVSFGVAPLLFVQTLWGRLFFPSSVTMASLWIAVIPILILAYYGTYRLAMAGENARGTGIVAALSALFFVVIAFLYSNNMSAMLRPEEVAARYMADASGWALNLSDPTFWPRFLHVVFGALAVAGLGVAGLGLLRRRAEPGFATFAMRHGALWFVAATVASIVSGFAWFLLLPRDVMLRFLGGSALATGLLAAGVLLGLAALLIMTLALAAKDPEPLLRPGIAVVLATLIVMVLERHEVRVGYLERIAFLPSPWVEPQWDVIVIFLVLLAAALATIGWMIRPRTGGSVT